MESLDTNSSVELPVTLADIRVQIVRISAILPQEPEKLSSVDLDHRLRFAGTMARQIIPTMLSGPYFEWASGGDSESKRANNIKETFRQWHDTLDQLGVAAEEGNTDRPAALRSLAEIAEQVAQLGKFVDVLLAPTSEELARRTKWLAGSALGAEKK